MYVARNVKYEHRTTVLEFFWSQEPFTFLEMIEDS